ncbi:N-acetylmuramoyl-L-alanine amidase [Elusimicrobium simillimum]|uniref:N-acetylmuramoyl-L-alanine amidase n=1 Tax=Elusimicrobium simillimum TaxID=3143438 RepID=UPI003C701A5F
MKRTVFLAFLLIFCATIHAADVPVAANLPLREANPKTVYPISVEFPHENMAIDAGAKSIFLFGSVADPKANLTINGVEVPVYSNGGFLTFLPVEVGDFTFLLQTTNGETVTQATRTVKVKGTDTKVFTTAQFDPKSILPKTDVWALPGDKIELAAYAVPGAEVTATITGIKDAKDIAFTETEPGLYKAAYTMQENDKAKAAKVNYKINHPASKTKNKITAGGKIKILDAKEPLSAEVKLENTRIRTQAVTQGFLYPFYRMFGNVNITGLANNMYRVKLTDTDTGWIEAAKIKFTKKPLELNKVETVTSENLDTKTRIIFYGTRKAPLLTTSTTEAFEVTMFNTEEYLPVVEAPASALVASISFEIAAANTMKFKINYHEGQPLWGYDYAFENGNFVLELIHKPILTPIPGKPLKGAKIMLDPGHSPKRRPNYDGAVGPTGLLEYEVNMATAKEVAALLEKTGASVLMSKNEKEQTSLATRTQRAIKEGAHIFVSIHHNALPVSVSPFARKRGFVIYYFNEHSKPLALSLNDAFAANVKLPNNGTQVGDFSTVRAPQFPSVLTENAFLMFPEQEDMVRNADTRAAFVKAIYEGILGFYGVKPEPPVKPKNKGKKLTVKKAAVKIKKK